MLYKRYANPMELLDGMLDAGNLCGFVGNVIEFYNEDNKEKSMWEYWLHKDWKHTWQEFLQESRNGNTQAAPTQAETLEIVEESMRMMQSFTPDGGGEMNGNIQTAGRDRDRCIEGAT